MVIRLDARAARRILAIAGLALGAALATPPSRACVTCDTSNKCHSGDEQGGYLCRTSEVHCGLLAQIFGVQCKAATCETLIVCDNRAPAKDRPEAAVSTTGARCPPAVPADPPPQEPETSADSE
jgi:hypothetical protein